MATRSVVSLKRAQAQSPAFCGGADNAVGVGGNRACSNASTCACTICVCNCAVTQTQCLCASFCGGSAGAGAGGGAGGGTKRKRVEEGWTKQEHDSKCSLLLWVPSKRTLLGDIIFVD